MSAWAKGFWLGVFVGLVVASIAVATTRFEAFVRIGADDRIRLDARIDEPVVGRVLNVPAGVLGEAALVKQSWVVVTAYNFRLRFRPGVSSDAGRALQGVAVSAALPGAVTGTNATRVAGRTVMWDTIPPDGVQVQTRAVHWVTIIVLLAVGVVALSMRRRS